MATSKATKVAKSSLNIAVSAISAVFGLIHGGAFAQEVPDDGVYKDHIDWGVLMDLSGPTSSSGSPPSP